MNGPESTESTADRPLDTLGTLVRHWRRRRGKSQLDLALDVGVSQRHVSFVESGRSGSSRALLLGIADALEMPFRERNALLLAAGYAPMYSDRPWASTEMRTVNRALERLLRQHEPFPALVLDRWWNVLMTNDCAPRFFGRFIDLSRHPKPRNLLHLMFDPAGMRPYVGNWNEVARGLFQRIGRESIGGVMDDRTRTLIAELMAYPDVAVDREPTESPSAAPVLSITFVERLRLLRYFSLVATVGTPQAIATQELRVECMFPADDATEAWHLQTFGSPTTSG